jgi:hypothetical protein
MILNGFIFNNFRLSSGAGLVEGEEAGEDRVVEPARPPVVAPAVGLGDGLVEAAVGEVEPGGALVVEAGQRAFPQELRRRVVLRQDAVGIARDRSLTPPCDPSNPARRRPRLRFLSPWGSQERAHPFTLTRW